MNGEKGAKKCQMWKTDHERLTGKIKDKLKHSGKIIVILHFVVLLLLG